MENYCGYMVIHLSYGYSVVEYIGLKGFISTSQQELRVSQHSGNSLGS